MWAKDKTKLQQQVNQAFEELGFEFPKTEAQLERFDEKFKDFPHKLDPRVIDPKKIIFEVAREEKAKGK